MKVAVGLDPGIAWFGVCAMSAELDGGRVRFDLIDGGVLRTEKQNRKRNVSVISDDCRRHRFIALALDAFISRHGATIMIAEERSFARGANAVKSMSAAWAIIMTLSALRGIPVVTVSPKDLKLAMTGGKSASKLDVELAVIGRHPNAGAVIELADVPDSQHHHFFDALGAAEACASNDQVLAWIR